MSKLAAIEGQLVSIKNVSTHKSACLTIHVPEEYALKVIEAFGWPTMVAPVHVAIARINPHAKPEAPAEKAKRPWDELSIAQQAGILCGEKRFQVFVGEQMAKTRGAGFRQDLVSVDDAAWYVRSVCGVNSRAHIERDAEATRKFRDLETNYQVWQTVPA